MGRAAGRVLVGRDTRGSGPELEAALDARDRRRPAGPPCSAGVLPTPAVALLSQDLGLVVSASHNPPEYNGVKVFDREGHKLSDADELEIEALLDAPWPGRRLGRGGATTRSTGYVDHVLEHFGSDLAGLRIAVDCANGAYSAIAPAVFERLGATVTRARGRSRRDEHQRGLRRDRSRVSCRRPSGSGDYDLGVAFDGDGDRMLAVDAHGEIVDGDQISRSARSRSASTSSPSRR